MGPGDYSLVSDGFLGKAVKASKRTAFWNSLSLDLTKFEIGSGIHIQGMMKILEYPDNKSAKANIIVKNENGEQKSFRIIGQTTLTKEKSHKWFNIGGEFKILKGDKVLYFQIPNYTGDYLLDHVTFGPNEKKCVKKCDLRNFGSKIENGLRAKFPESHYVFDLVEFEITEADGSFKYKHKCKNSKKSTGNFGTCRILKNGHEKWLNIFKSDPGLFC